MAMNNFEINQVKRDIKKQKEITGIPSEMDLLCRVEICILELEKRNIEKSAKIEVLKEILTNK